MINELTVIILFFGAVALLIPIALIILGAVTKKRKLVVICSIILVVEILLVTAYCIAFPTCFPYCDLWIIGKSREQIIDVYGEPHDRSGATISYYIGEDSSWIMPSHLPQYYYIVFDENGYACEVYAGGPKGG